MRFYRVKTMQFQSPEVNAKSFDEAILALQLLVPYNDWETLRVKKFTQRLDPKTKTWSYAMPNRKRFF
jgi:hypothetical protein